jgi:hypothetical protein
MIEIKEVLRLWLAGRGKKPIGRQRGQHRDGGKAGDDASAADQLHGQETGPALGRGVQSVDRRDVGVVQRGQQLGLALEAPQPLDVRCERLGQHLDRHPRRSRYRRD